MTHQADRLIVREIGPDELHQALNLRYDALDKPIGIKRKLYPSVNDLKEATIHVGAFLDDELVSVVRLDQIDSRTYLVRRMATGHSFRRRGFGRMVLSYAEKTAKLRGGKNIILHSRPEAVAFYENLGYVATGSYEKHDGLCEPEMIKKI